MDKNDLDTNALFTQYVNVVNKALAAHRDEFPMKQLSKAGEKLVGGKEIGAAVYKNDPDAPHDYFTVTMEGGRFQAEQGKGHPDIEWKVKQQHIENVVENPDEFIAHPLKLDLDWLSTRFGKSESN